MFRSQRCALVDHYTPYYIGRRISYKNMGDGVLSEWTVAVLPLQSPILSALKELERTGTNMESNAQLRLTRCSCGEYHMCVTACRELVKGDVLVPADHVQFDGSAHRTSQVGGAGAALLQFDGNGLALLDWDARVLPKCADNIVAECACVMNRAWSLLWKLGLVGEISLMMELGSADLVFLCFVCFWRE